MRYQFGEVHSRIDALHFKIESMDTRIDNRLTDFEQAMDSRFAEQDAKFAKLLESQFAHQMFEISQTLGPWMNKISHLLDDHSQRISTIEGKGT